ncbi:alkaline phosphatase family protein [Spirochaetota bacterium]
MAIYIIIALICITPLFPYIDPGSGLPILTNLTAIIGSIIAFLAAAFFPVKILLGKVRNNRKLFFTIIALSIIIIAVLLIAGISILSRSSTDKKLIVIGIDALDPDLVEKYTGEGILPHFKKLMDNGDFKRLTTTTPPQSPVAWSAFATGMNPGNTGLFDFISRDPNTYFPQLEFTEFKVESKDIKIGKLTIPVQKLRILNKRQGKPFWSYLTEHGIPSVVIRCPLTFPPDKIQGRLLSGMGVPDIRGTQGMFAFFTTRDSFPDSVSGGTVIKVKNENDTIETRLPGPIDVSSGRRKEFSTPLTITINEEKSSVALSINGETINIKQYEWSPWVRVSFKIAAFRTARGICRFYAQNIKDGLELYCTPVNFDPDRPLFPISHPKSYAKKLRKKFGYYYTQGMPHDTKALSEEIISEDVYLQMSDRIFDYNKKIYFHEFEQFESGVLFIYFEALDTLQHVFFHHTDPAHPAYNKSDASKYGNVIRNYYRKFDSFIGEMTQKLDDDITLIVLSDHGFGPFYRLVHMNSWLRDNGFLSLKEGEAESGDFFRNVDWSRTKAYSLGFNSIFINQAGREKHGIVKPGLETEKTKDEIKKALLAWKDNGKPVMKNVYTKEEAYRGKYLDKAPDLVCGYREGYRASWQTAIGGVPKALIEDNKKKWSGDHLFDPSEVPASLIMNRKILKEKPAIIDIVPTILKFFGIMPEEELDGEPLF